MFNLKVKIPEPAEKLIQYNIYFYPYRKVDKYECRISYAGNIDLNKLSPAVANTEKEAKEKALKIFLEAYSEYHPITEKLSDVLPDNSNSEGDEPSK